ncbi:calcipressin-2-like [Tropilaelaps mercedesae]|uniref:Calcipressin-2-like n=1 Tax=Tropilaelaps mercedesae TaxID=418985 RepID=A0A1V9XWN4_9ACAR|nr:calcipressin-2-like [Tropilaelaps mercedesae]
MEASEYCGSGGVERPMEMDQADEDLTDLEDLPSSLIVANMEPGVFANMQLRTEFEEIFRAFDADATFQYLKSFRRVRVTFTTPQIALEARIRCHEVKFGENRLVCYFAQHVDKENNNDDPYLQPPLPYKQFLISPPASPPVGWEPVAEAEPTINYDILSAIANLAPGETHELHPQSEKHPGIIVHVCEQDEEHALNTAPVPKIVQTSRPPLPLQQ